MALEVTGKLHKIFDTQQVTERFNKREFVLELAGKYPQLILFQLTGKHCSDLDGHEPGEELRIEFSLRGREWTSRQGEVKYFNSLDVAKLERVGAGPRPSPGEAANPKRAAKAQPEEEAIDDEEVPF